MKKYLAKFLVLIALTVSGCSLDLETKDLVNQELKHRSIPVVDHFFHLTYLENHAIAFGLFSEVERGIRMPIILALPTLVILFGLFMIWKMRKSRFRVLLPLFIILGGAFGNILDRIMHGYVTDFLHLHFFDYYHFYVFNVADVLVNIGFILLIIQYKDFQQGIRDAFEKNTEPEPA